MNSVPITRDEPAVLPTRDECIRRAQAVMNQARAEREYLAATGGPEAVAEAAWNPAGPSKAEIAATYAALQAEARARRDTGRGHPA